MQWAVHAHALRRIGMAFLSAITLSFSWNDTCNIFMFDKQCSSAASNEVSCCKTWRPSTSANFSAVLWISAFRGKPTWSLVELWISKGVTFSSPAPCLLSLLPASCHGASSLHLHQSNNRQSCHSLPTEHSKLWQWIDPSCGSCLVRPYVKQESDGIMYYCNEEGHKLQWGSMQ